MNCATKMECALVNFLAIFVLFLVEETNFEIFNLKSSTKIFSKVKVKWKKPDERLNSPRPSEGSPELELKNYEMWDIKEEPEPIEVSI